MAKSLKIGPKVLVKWALGRYVRMRAQGQSMLPTITPEDQLFIDKRAEIQVEKIVVAKHPIQDTLIVKRIQRISQGMIWLTSDNSAVGSDSRDFGPVDKEAIIGTVVAKV